MNKESLTPRPLSPKEKQEHGYHFGKGVYSALQLKNLLTSKAPTEEEAEKFVIKIPKDRLNAIKKGSFAIDSILKPSLSIAKGFKDTSTEHTKNRKDHLKKQLEDAQQQYLEALTHAKKASLEIPTPNIDAFCVGILSALEKDAHEESISDGALMRTAKNIAHPITKHLPSLHTARENLVDKPLIGSMLAMYLMKSMNRPEQSENKHPLHISVEAI